MVRYLDHYPDCIGCPVAKYCGTMVRSVRLCNSYIDKEKPEAEQKLEKAKALAESLGYDANGGNDYQITYREYDNRHTEICELVGYNWPDSVKGAYNEGSAKARNSKL